MFKNKKLTILYISIAIVFIGLLVVFSLFDLQISKALVKLEEGEYYSSSFILRFLETVGEMPIYVFISCAFIIFYYNAEDSLIEEKKKTVKKVIYAICAFISYFLASKVLIKYVAQHHGFEYMLGGLDYVCYLLMAGIDTAITIYVFSKIDQTIIKRLYVFAMVVLLTALISQVLTQGVKIFWGRARYRMMATLQSLGEDGFSYYTEWFKCNGKRSVSLKWLDLGIASDGFKSFPSGHTCAAAITSTLICLPFTVEKLNTKKCRIAFISISVIYTVIVALSRVLMGAHFASDVLVGGMVTFVSCLISFKLVVKNKKFFKVPPKPTIVTIKEETI